MRKPGRIEGIGFAGGLFDALGGGGWGPIVTASLVGSGHDARMAIGTANRAEFFVTVAQSATFIAAIGFGGWRTAAALCVGGALAAPLAAHAARRLDPKTADADRRPARCDTQPAHAMVVALMSSRHETHLSALENEAIHILREVAAQFERSLLLFSGGKDSIVTAWLARKAFHPARAAVPSAAHRHRPQLP